MKIERAVWSASEGWSGESALKETKGFVIAFYDRQLDEADDVFKTINARYPHAEILGCSTGGEIYNDMVEEASISTTAVNLEKATFRIASATVVPGESCLSACESIASALTKEGLRHVVVFSDGLSVNGTELADGLASHLAKGVGVTGGLAGDGARFEETSVIANAKSSKNTIVALGLYGDAIKIGFGSYGGWEAFGPVRTVTKSKDNVLFELDGEPALDLYKRYLGPQAKDLPASGLLFPLLVKSKENSGKVVRTLLAIDEDAHSMTFAGDISTGSTAQLMKSNTDKLLYGAGQAGEISLKHLDSEGTDLAILVSCIGRKLVLKQRVEEEIEAVREKLGDAAAITGFYSYGEICPRDGEERSELHNQTMTVTLISES